MTFFLLIDSSWHLTSTPGMSDRRNTTIKILQTSDGLSASCKIPCKLTPYVKVFCIVSISSQSPSSEPQFVERRFDDIDAMAASAFARDQECEQIGRGRFQGRVTQLVLDQVQLARESWTPGILQRGSAPVGTWMFGLPLAAEGSLHIRRRPVCSGELLAATSHDDIGLLRPDQPT